MGSIPTAVAAKTVLVGISAVMEPKDRRGRDLGLGSATARN
jgi:hypothetical protein